MRSASLAIRSLCAALLAWYFCWNLLAYNRLRQGIAPPAKPAATSSTVAPAPAVLDAGALEGYWIFDGFPWTAQVDTVVNDELPGRFEAHFDDVAPERQRSSTSLEPEILALVAAVGGQPERHGERLIYRGKSPQLRWQAVCRVGPPGRLLGLQAALPVTGGRWSLVTLRSGGAAGPTPDGQRLTPPVPNSKLIAARFDMTGRRLAEILSFESWVDLQSGWQQAGCLPEDAPSRSQQSTPLTFVNRAGERLGVWRLSESGALAGTVLVVEDSDQP